VRNPRPPAGTPTMDVEGWILRFKGDVEELDGTELPDALEVKHLCMLAREIMVEEPNVVRVQAPVSPHPRPPAPPTGGYTAVVRPATAGLAKPRPPLPSTGQHMW
jgi:hypothetical protein